MTRVLHVIAGLQVGGAEGGLVRLLRNARGVEHVGVVSVLGDGPLRSEVEATGTPVVLAGSHAARSVPNALATLRRSIRRLRPDVIQSYMYGADLLASLASGGVPVVWGVLHGHLPGAEASRATRVAARVLARGLAGRPAAIHYNSHAARRAHEQAGYPAPLGTVIHNGVRTADLPHDAARTHLLEALGNPADDRPIALRVGRFNAQKDFPGLLRAWASLPDDTVGRLVLVGPDVDRAPVVRDAVATSHPDRPVHAFGARDDARDLAAGADLAVSNSSDGESCPSVVVEALAAGTPVLGTDVGDTALLVSDHGRIVPPRDPDRLAEALAAMLREPPPRFDGTAIGERHAPEREAAAFESLWRQAAGPA